MKYYLVLSDELVEELSTLFDDKFLLAEKVFDNVYTRQGFKIFEKLLESETLAKEMKIYDEEGEKIGIQEFIEFLEDNDVRIENA